MPSCKPPSSTSPTPFQASRSPLTAAPLHRASVGRSLTETTVSGQPRSHSNLPHPSPTARRPPFFRLTSVLEWTEVAAPTSVRNLVDSGKIPFALANRVGKPLSATLPARNSRSGRDSKASAQASRTGLSTTLRHRSPAMFRGAKTTSTAGPDADELNTSLCATRPPRRSPERPNAALSRLPASAASPGAQAQIGRRWCSTPSTLPCHHPHGNRPPTARDLRPQNRP